MSDTTKATFYLDSKLYHAFRVKAAVADKKISDLMNETLRLQLKEDEADIKTMRSRAHGPVENYKDFLSGLKTDGLI